MGINTGYPPASCAAPASPAGETAADLGKDVINGNTAHLATSAWPSETRCALRAVCGVLYIHTVRSDLMRIGQALLSQPTVRANRLQSAHEPRASEKRRVASGLGMCDGAIMGCLLSPDCDPAYHVLLASFHPFPAVAPGTPQPLLLLQRRHPY